MALTGTSAYGSGVRLAAGKQSSWNTAVAVTDVLPYLKESLTPQRNYIESGYMSGRVGKEDSVASVQDAIATVEFEPVIDIIAGDPFGWELLLTAMIGPGTWDAANSLTKYAPASALTALTLAANKSVSIWEMVGAKVKTWELSGAFKEAVKGKIDFVGQKVLRTGESGITNTVTTVTTNLTPTAKPSILDIKDLTFRIGTHGDALAAGDKVGISSFRLSGDNALGDSDYATEENSGHTNSDFPLEHQRDGFRSLNLEIKIPRYHSDAFFDWASGGNLLMADMVFAVGSKSLAIYLPYLKITQQPTAPTDGPGALEVTVNLEGYINGSVNTDMAFTDASAITQEIAFEAKSNRTAAP